MSITNVLKGPSWIFLDYLRYYVMFAHRSISSFNQIKNQIRNVFCYKIKISQKQKFLLWIQAVGVHFPRGIRVKKNVTFFWNAGLCINSSLQANKWIMFVGWAGHGGSLGKLWLHLSHWTKMVAPFSLDKSLSIRKMQNNVFAQLWAM